MIYIMRRDEGEKLKIREHRDAGEEREREEIIKRSESTGQRASRNKPEFAVRLNSFVRGRQIQRIRFLNPNIRGMYRSIDHRSIEIGARPRRAAAAWDRCNQSFPTGCTTLCYVPILLTPGVKSFTPGVNGIGTNWNQLKSIGTSWN